MDNVIELSDYRQQPENKRETSMVDFPWSGEEFKLRNTYYDRAKEPPVPVHHTINEFRSLLMDMVPRKRGMDSAFRPLMSKLYMPFTFDADPYWVIGGLDEAYLNHEYEPFAALMLVIRDYPEDLFDMIVGVTVESENVYESYKRKFNSHFLKLLNNRGSGDNRMASEDEMIRLGALFMVLLHTASHHEGLVLDSDRRFENAWCGRRKIVSWKYKDLLAYSRKLKKSYESGLPWEKFYHRYVWESDDQSFWFINTPAFENDGYLLHPEFSKEELYKLLGEFAPTISSTGARLMICAKLTEKTQKRIQTHFHFSQVDDGVYRSRLMMMYPNFYPSSYYEGNFCLFTNYEPRETTGYRKLKREAH